MSVSQKCQYALRAVFELSKRWGNGPTTVADIAEAQAIPPRFLELILGQLKHAGFVESRRGAKGGYLLAVAPGGLTVREVLEYVDGPVAPVRCVLGEDKAECPLEGNCAFMGLWSRARDAVAKVYDETSFENLMEEERASNGKYVASYCI